jgi:hypothetical protein
VTCPCGKRIPAAAAELCAICGEAICPACFEGYGYGADHTDEEINATSLLGPESPRQPKEVRREALGEKGWKH